MDLKQFDLAQWTKTIWKNTPDNDRIEVACVLGGDDNRPFGRDLLKSFDSKFVMQLQRYQTQMFG